MREQHRPIHEQECILDDDSNPYYDVEWLSNRIRHLPFLPDAFFCANDYLAVCMVKALKKLNVSIPSDIMICGFDDAPEATIITPPLTTVCIPSRSMGYIASELLLSRIKHPDMPYRTTYVKTDVVFRASTNRK